MRSPARLALLSLACVAALACSRGDSSRDPESLGYGPQAGRDLAYGYLHEQGSPFERPAPIAWPIDQQPRRSFTSVAPVLAATPPPIPVSVDVRRLCVHVVEFLASESSEPIDAAAIGDFCQLQARTEKLSRTAEQWQRFSTCILAANTDPEFDACEAEYPTSLAEPSEHPREREVCQHLVMTTVFEEAGSDANLEASALEGFRVVIRECVEGLISNQRPERSPEDYADLLECVLEQSTSDAIEACE